MIRSRSPYTCIGNSTGDLRHFDMIVRCAAHYAGATLNGKVRPMLFYFLARNNTLTLRQLGTKSKTRLLRSILRIVKSRKWRPELIESAAEFKRHTRWRSLMIGLPIANFATVQSNISSKYPLQCVVFLSQQTYVSF